MVSKITGLGRGLGSLIPKKPLASAIREENKEVLLAEPAGAGIMQIPVEQIEPNPQQPRRVFGHEEMEGLVESIKQFGIIQPLIVTKRLSGGYELIAGERRWRAAKIAGLPTVPAVVRAAGEQEKLELAIIENLQRKNLNPIERAAAYQKLLHEFNLTQEAVAEKMSVSRSAVANTLRYLDLPEAVQKALVDGAITEGHAKIIAGLPNDKEQLEFLNKILQNDLTVQSAADVVKTVRRVARRAARDPFIEDKEARLRSALNTKVSIKKTGADKGQIVIDYYSAEELEELMKKIINCKL